VSFLLGTRALTTSDTTFILEYYRNGTGFTEEEMANFFGFVNDAYQTYVKTGSDALCSGRPRFSTANYGRVNTMRDYLYLRITRKNPLTSSISTRRLPRSSI